nr:small heat shock protein [Naineris dendritica]
MKPYKRSFSSLARLTFLGKKSDKGSKKGEDGKTDTDIATDQETNRKPDVKIKVSPSTPTQKQKPYKKSSSISFFSSMLKKGDDNAQVSRDVDREEDVADLIPVPVTRKTSPLMPDPSQEEREPVTVKTVNGSIPGSSNLMPHTLPRARRTQAGLELNGIERVDSEQSSLPDLVDDYDEDEEDDDDEYDDETASGVTSLLPPILRKRSKKSATRPAPNKEGSSERRAHFREQVEVLQQDAEGNPLRVEVELKQGISFGGHFGLNKDKAKKAKSLRHIFPSEDIVVIKQRNGKKKLRLVVHIGSGFSSDKIAVRALKGGKKLHVTAEKAEQMADGSDFWREFTDKFVLPHKINPYKVKASFDIIGDLCIEAPFAESLF